MEPERCEDGRNPLSEKGFGPPCYVPYAPSSPYGTRSCPSRPYDCPQGSPSWTTTSTTSVLEPFRPHFHPTDGRPSVPMETYLRMMTPGTQSAIQP